MESFKDFTRKRLTAYRDSPLAESARFRAGTKSTEPLSAMPQPQLGGSGPAVTGSSGYAESSNYRIQIVLEAVAGISCQWKLLFFDSNWIVREAAGDITFVRVDHVLPVLVGGVIAGIND